MCCLMPEKPTGYGRLSHIKICKKACQDFVKKSLLRHELQRSFVNKKMILAGRVHCLGRIYCCMLLYHLQISLKFFKGNFSLKKWKYCFHDNGLFSVLCLMNCLPLSCEGVWVCTSLMAHPRVDIYVTQLLTQNLTFFVESCGRF